MARPRVFVSSTYYDLKYVRSALESFIKSLGYDPILSEKGDIAYLPDRPLDQSCYKEAENSDIYVLIIGGRYGSASSPGGLDVPEHFSERYESITKMEYETAKSNDIPIYILVDRSVYSEYDTFKRNRNTTVTYAHVDSVNIFHFLDEIFAQPRNNPVYPFEQSSDIELWLREQWAGLFRDLLHTRSTHQRLSSLATQVAQLAEVNQTLRRYLEEVVEKVAPNEARSIIEQEGKRLELTGQFIGLYNRLEQTLISLASAHTLLGRMTGSRQLDLMQAARFLKDRGILPEAEFILIDSIRRLRNTVVHGPTDDKDNLSQETIDKLIGLLRLIEDMASNNHLQQ